MIKLKTLLEDTDQNNNGYPDSTEGSADSLMILFSGTDNFMDKIAVNVFKKYGLLKTYLNPEMCKNLVPTSEDFFNDQERIAETFKDPKNYKKFQKLLNYIPSPEKVQYHVENIGMKKEILDYASKICNLVSAVSADNINSLNQNEKDLLIDLGLEFISNFSNASKLKEQSPKIYDAIASEGSDAVDSFSTLGDLGF